jgi:tagatose 6-phosphate kinase
MRRPGRLHDVPIVGVTFGPHGLRAWVGERCWNVASPEGLEIVNPLGAGDAVTAGLAAALHAGEDPLRGFVRGVGMATARLRHLTPELDAVEADTLARAVRVTPVG